MDTLRRLFGGGGGRPASPKSTEADPASIAADESAYELDLLRGEQERLDELAQRQLRYADYAWEPPRQGGERRAEDGDEPGQT
jgi:hypothetical protein